ncbi:type I-F CRISPR-associated protein Csy3 [Uruburuella testudinis]|uniref:Type I-F CRISPR-associated protein Csy3 n=1 Tax=Uruburuella testudinis TaxID=1282863 RepID=A0ABY4DV64_9NEIS|nr:type I-F CRISPR-associated protein Csy3 [Uruburuella testudinis]UOO82560.1 type I-F CRISPR-associated protein Csy3 [Uruburuella testudinis]
MSKLEIASVLAFERNLDISDAWFCQCGDDGARKPVSIREKSVRGTISNRLKNAVANDPAKLDAEIQKPNLQKVDVATLDEDCHTLIARFTLKSLPFDGRPNSCNNPDYQAKLRQAIDAYLTANGTRVLALRYAANIANARWLWRNRMGAESIRITVSNRQEQVVITNSKSLSLNEFNSNAETEIIANWIEQGLNGVAFTLLEIEAEAKVGYGQEVYPSQELILDTGRSNKSKVLYQIGNNAGMHSQKISNAIRTIDTWYSPDAAFPIAAEPYGAVTTMGVAFRQPKQKNDFYTLFDNWILKDQAPAIEQQHYIISVLLRGGVFGASGKE